MSETGTQELSAGTVLNGLIEERVFGGRPIEIDAGLGHTVTLYVEPGRRVESWNARHPRHYSESIADAWRVVEKMASMHPSYSPDRWYVKVWNCYALGGEVEWVCTIHDSGERNKYVSPGRSAPEAICNTALRALSSINPQESPQCLKHPRNPPRKSLVKPR